MKARSRAASSSTRASSTSTSRPIKSIRGAGTWADSVGVGSLLPGADLVLPSLWEADAGTREVEWGVQRADGKFEFTAEMARCWQWKDELPERGLAPAAGARDARRPGRPRRGDTPHGRRDRALQVRLIDGAREDSREPGVEFDALGQQHRVAVAEPRERVCDDPDSLSEVERRDLAAPRLEERVAKPGVGRIPRRHLDDLLEDAEGDDEREERVRDRRVAPVEDAQGVAVGVDVA